MKKISIIFLFLLLTSCTSVGRFGTGVDITFDPRTIGMQIDDTIVKNLSARLALTDKKYFLSIQSVLDGIFYQVKLMNLRKNSEYKNGLGNKRCQICKKCYYNQGQSNFKSTAKDI